ncbi:MAG: DUF4276 family protein [Bryobacteraceae bacterium]|nr:DUF4276 family protein [Bryobacteraceae bacterium]
MKIAWIVEGKTEKALKPPLIAFLESRLKGSMPRLDVRSENGLVPKEARLKRLVEGLLQQGYGAVIALTDVYTGQRSFADAADAKSKLNGWVGANPKFHAHAAQFEFEAWLLPYWPRIQKQAGSSRKPPSGNPENVNHHKPPSKLLEEVFRTGNPGRRYLKTIDSIAILRDQDISLAAAECTELKAFLNTILTVCGAQPLP